MNESNITVSYNNFIDEGFFDDFLGSTQDAEMTSELQSRYVGPQAFIEWLGLTYVAVKIFEPFIKDIHNRVAKDFGDAIYPKVKKAIGKLAEKVLLRTDWKIVTASGTEKPREGRSAFFSIVSETKDKSKIQFVFEEGCKPKEYETMVDKAIELLLTHHTSGNADSLSDAPEIWHTVYMGFDSSDNQWNPIDVNEEIRTLSGR